MVEWWSNVFTMFALRSRSFLVIFGQLAIRRVRIPKDSATIRDIDPLAF
jgi:hypothetical protein